MKRPVMFIIFNVIAVFAMGNTPLFSRPPLSFPLVFKNTDLAVKRDTQKSEQAAQMFVPGEITPTASCSASPAFSPSGKSVYIGQSQGNAGYVIMKSEQLNGKWSSLIPASFSGRYRDLEPAYSPDGKYLIFASNRPINSGDSLLDGHFNGQTRAGGGGNLWRVSVSKKGEGAAVPLPVTINSNTTVFSPAVAAKGTLYFMRADSGAKFHIYRSAFKNGAYENPVKASFSLDQFGDFDPAVAPDESFLIFSSARPPAPKTADLFIVFRTSKGWSDPIDLRTILGDKVHGIEARLSPDLTKLYYSNSQNQAGAAVSDEEYIWEVGIAALLKDHGIIK